MRLQQIFSPLSIPVGIFDVHPKETRKAVVSNLKKNATLRNLSAEIRRLVGLLELEEELGRKTPNID